MYGIEGLHHPAPTDPRAAPPRRPAVVAVALVLYLVNAGVLTASFLIGMSAADGTPWPLVFMAVVVAALFVGLVFGVWHGREVARWVLTRIGIGFGGVFFLGGVINLAVTQGLDASTAVQAQGVLNLVSAALYTSGGLLLLTRGVRAWCGKRVF